MPSPWPPPSAQCWRHNYPCRTWVPHICSQWAWPLGWGREAAGLGPPRSPCESNDRQRTINLNGQNESLKTNTSDKRPVMKTYLEVRAWRFCVPDQCLQLVDLIGARHQFKLVPVLGSRRGRQRVNVAVHLGVAHDDDQMVNCLYLRPWKLSRLKRLKTL